MSRSTGAVIDAPAWMWGGHPGKFFDAAKLRVRETSGTARRVQVSEQYLRAKRPLLVDAITVLDPNGKRAGGFAIVEGLVDEGIESVLPQRLREKGIAIPQFTGEELHDRVNQTQLDLQLLPGDEIATYCEEMVAGMREMRFSSGPREPVFPHVSVHAIRRDPALVYRAKLSAILVRMERDPALARGDLSGVMATTDVSRSAFGSSESLLQGIYLFDVYLAPLEAALTPAVWVFAARRVHGTVLVSFGRPLKGPSTNPNDLFGVLRHPGDVRDVRGEYQQFVEPSAAEAAISWWALRLDLMFGVLSDPAIFTTPEGRFDPLGSMQARMSVEQLFQRVLSVQLAHRDTHARRVAFFSAMDTYRSLAGGPSMQQLFTHASALKTLERVREAVPAVAHDVLLPNAERAVAALRDLQDGFFLTNDDDTVRLDARRPSVSREQGAAHYLATLRDATHGFSTTDSRQRERVANLLVAHTGEVSHDIGLIAWLYLLDFLVQRERLGNVLSSGHWALGRGEHGVSTQS